MIWIWICLAVSITVFVCRKDRIEPQYYIWTLLPIEMYGVSIAGATIKPYMIFGIILILSTKQQTKRFALPKSLALISVVLFLTDCLNGLIVASIMQHLMFILVMYLAYIFVQSCNYRISIRQLKSIVIATTIGYGTTFIVAYLLMNRFSSSLQIFTMDRFTPGMFLRFISTGGVESIRLRGFCIDPNSVITTLVIGGVFALHDVLVEQRERAKGCFAILLFTIVVILSGSRMAMMCSIGMLFLMMLRGYRESSNKAKWMISSLFAFACLLVIQSSGLIDLFGGLKNAVFDIYSSRAGLTEEAGRFTIWSNNISYLFESGKMWFGVGQNQIFLLSGYGKACHNTWLEWICGIGLFAGVAIDIWFISIPFVSMKRTESSAMIKTYRETLIIAYCVVMLCITTVDNITNSSLIFLMTILRYGTLCMDDRSDRIYL